MIDDLAPLAVGAGGVPAGLLLNRLIHLWSRERPFWGGAQRCGRCDATLPWATTVPGLGLLWRGAARACGHGGEPWRGLTLLLLPAGGWALAATLAAPGRLAPALVLLAVLWVLAVIDALTHTVEPRVVAAGIVLRLAGLLTVTRADAAEMVGGLLVGAGLFTLLGFFYQTLRGRTGLGEGDAVVMALIGAHVGWKGVLPVAALAAVAGLIFGFPWLLWRRRGLAQPLPFVPFLAAAGFAVYLGRLYGWWEELGLPWGR